MRTAESIETESDLDLDTLRSELGDHPVQVAILFGSHATETAHAESDIDLAVEFENQRPPDTGYNDVFLGLSADLSSALGTDAVDLVDLHAVSPTLAAAIFENGVLIKGSREHAATLRRQLTDPESEHDSRTPRERIDAALDRIDDHLSEDPEVPVTGRSEDGR